jgi:2,3-bisphosphoglycerate-dependent phosphoglycerate mutase
MQTVWLIRHGESEANAGLPTEKPQTIELTAKGHQQAKDLASAFVTPPNLIVTSPYLRARQTVRYTCDRFPEVPFAEWEVQEFTYLAPIRYLGTTTDRRRPMVEVYWQHGDPLFLDGEGAESFSDMIIRVKNFFQRVRETEAESIAIFTHEQLIKAMLWFQMARVQEIDSIAMAQYRAFLNAWKIPNCSIIEYKFDRDRFWHTAPIVGHLSQS